MKFSDIRCHCTVNSYNIQHAANTYGWDLEKSRQCREDLEGDPRVQEVEIDLIRRPLQGSRQNNKEKVDVLKQSIAEIGLLEPIDVLLVDGVYYGFSGCHRFQAHQELGKKTILCRVRRATKQTLKYHLM